jgi:hypothetical protein
MFPAEIQSSQPAIFDAFSVGWREGDFGQGIHNYSAFWQELYLMHQPNHPKALQF